MTGWNSTDFDDPDVQSEFLETLAHCSCDEGTILSYGDLPDFEGEQDRLEVRVAMDLPASRRDESATLACLQLAFHNGTIIRVELIPPERSGAKGEFNIGLMVGVGLSGAFAALISGCRCRRKRGPIKSYDKAVDVYDPIVAQLPDPTLRTIACLDAFEPPITFEANKVFDWLDEDHDGMIGAEELAGCLNVSMREAEEIIDEIKVQQRGTSEGGLGGLSRQEFAELMDASTRTVHTMHGIPKACVDRYTLVFNSVDVENKGFITPEQLIAAMGHDNPELQEALANRKRMTLSQFIIMLRESELERSAWRILELLDDMGQGIALATAVQEAFRRNHAKRRRRGPSLARFASFNKKSDVPAQLPRYGSRSQLSRSITAKSHAMQKQMSRASFVGRGGDPNSEQEIANNAIEDIWEQSCDADGLADADELRMALMSAHVAGDVIMSDEAILTLAWSITEAGATHEEGRLTREAFDGVMEPYKTAAVANDTPTLDRRTSVQSVVTAGATAVGQREKLSAIVSRAKSRGSDMLPRRKSSVTPEMPRANSINVVRRSSLGVAGPTSPSAVRHQASMRQTSDLRASPFLPRNISCLSNMSALSFNEGDDEFPQNASGVLPRVFQNDLQNNPQEAEEWEDSDDEDSVGAKRVPAFSGSCKSFGTSFRSFGTDL